jgi:hypothetical protein
MGAEIFARVDKLWPKRHHELGPCLVWTGAKGPDAEKGPYGRVYDGALGKIDDVYKVVWRRVYPDKPIARGEDVDHMCEVALCARPDHGPRHEQGRQRQATRSHAGVNRRVAEPSKPPVAAQRFALALFAGMDRPTVEARTFALDELVTLLNRFEALQDKRCGRC